LVEKEIIIERDYNGERDNFDNNDNNTENNDKEIKDSKFHLRDKGGNQTDDEDSYLENKVY
jgi:hypothetical protein